MADLTTRKLSTGDYESFFAVFTAAFLDDSRDPAMERYREVFDTSLAHGTFDGDELIGVAGRFALDITVPGPARHPVAAISAVGVKPGHRRRGVLTSLMRAQPSSTSCTTAAPGSPRCTPRKAPSTAASATAWPAAKPA
ncbi:GNAT family N-acetyltransferase [Saccharopolyspora sp. NPDC050642]|uniref:GNAT family N-acetyltransferase n=1 Tax=Saccharopolyspora sp. NPDC050642 TaxID=3157099 RepID=UPI0033DB8D0B